MSAVESARVWTHEGTLQLVLSPTAPAAILPISTFRCPTSPLVSVPIAADADVVFAGDRNLCEGTSVVAERMF
jgi:hypothetical protein